MIKSFWCCDLRNLGNDFGNTGENRESEAGNGDFERRSGPKIEPDGKKPGELME